VEVLSREEINKLLIDLEDTLLEIKDLTELYSEGLEVSHRNLTEGDLAESADQGDSRWRKIISLAKVRLGKFLAGVLTYLMTLTAQLKDHHQNERKTPESAL
jgi:hypothetical protein